MSGHALHYVVPVRLEPGLWALHLRFQPGAGVPPGLGLDNIRIGILTDPGWPRLELSSHTRLTDEVIVTFAISPALLPYESAHVFEVVLVGVPGLAPGGDRAPFRLAAFRLDPEAPSVQGRPPLPEPAPIDYRARDYEAFRTALLTVMRTRVPGWVEESPADMGVVLAELVAWAGDQLSAYQDSVATESTLATARQRTSLRRHARLLDYVLHEGCNARTWLRLPAGDTRTLVPRSTAYTIEEGGDGVTFLTMHDCLVDRSRDEMQPHDWGLETFVLQTGTTLAAVVGHGTGLREGDAVAIRDGTAAHVVRLVAAPVELVDSHTRRAITRLAWAAEDALPRAFDAAETMFLGNVVLADQGGWEERKVPPVHHDPYEPGIAVNGLTWASDPELDARPVRPATALLEQDPRDAVACVELWELPPQPTGQLVRLRPADARVRWKPVRDLLSSGPADRHFVVESEPGRGVRLRFGDDVNGFRPAPGTQFQVRVRRGNGPSGNVSAGPLKGPNGAWAVGLIQARGGLVAEPSEQGRRAATRAWEQRVTLVTSADYATRAARFALVREAAASVAGHTPRVDVAVRPQAWSQPGPDWLARLEATLAVDALQGARLRVYLAREVELEVKARVEGYAGDPRRLTSAARNALIGSGSPLDQHRASLGVDVKLADLADALQRGLAELGGSSPLRVVFLRFGRRSGREDARASGIVDIAWDEWAVLRSEHLAVVGRGHEVAP